MQLQLSMGNCLPSESETEPQLCTKNCRQPRKAGRGEKAYPRKVCTNWLSALKTYTGSIIRTEQAIFGNICVYTYIYMHAITIRKIRS